MSSTNSNSNHSNPDQDTHSAVDNLLLQDDSMNAHSSSSPAELTAVVDALLDSLTHKFSSVSTEIFGKMDDMSRRLDALEEMVRADDGKD